MNILKLPKKKKKSNTWIFTISFYKQKVNDEKLSETWEFLPSSKKEWDLRMLTQGYIIKW